MAHSGLKIYMRNVPGKPNHRRLISSLPYKRQDGSTDEIPVGFEWDGASVPWIFQGLFPRHRHPIASCRHDWRCKNAKNKADRAWADKCFREDVRTTSWAITSTVAYLGVRIGAFFGVGSNF